MGLIGALSRDGPPKEPTRTAPRAHRRRAGNRVRTSARRRQGPRRDLGAAGSGPRQAASGPQRGGVRARVENGSGDPHDLSGLRSCPTEP